MKSRRPRILVTGAIDRPDILAMFREVAPRAALTFVEYYFNFGLKSHPEYYSSYGSLRFWHEFRHADALLDELRPDKIVFFYVSALNQVALKLAAQQRGIETHHLEHGFRQRFADSVDRFLMIQTNEQRLRLAKLRHEAAHIIRNHAFFLRSIPNVHPPARSELLAFAVEAYTRGVSLNVLQKFGRLRQPDHYIAFSPEIFEFHRVQDGVEDSDPNRVTFVGLPQFDQFCVLPATDIDPRNVLLVDHQFHEGNMFGWNAAFRREWARRIVDIMRKLNLRLFVKQHPGDKSNVWAPYVSSGDVEVTDLPRMLSILPSTRIVLGNFSTMQLPITGLPHTVLLTLEIHPEPGHMPSRQFVEAGVARAVTTFEDLHVQLADVTSLAEEQRGNKAEFVRQFLYAMDGQASTRLTEILLKPTKTMLCS